VKNLLFIFILIICPNLTFTQDNIDSLEVELVNDPNNVSVLIQLGRIYHDFGTEGDKEAVKMGEKYLENAVSLDSENAIAIAYYGSILTMKARDSKAPWNRIKHGRKGLSFIDRAVELEPNNLDVRIIRAMNSLLTPSFLGRLKYSFEDFEYVINNDHFKSWIADSKAYVYYNLGNAYKKDDKLVEAKKYYEMALKEAPLSESGKAAKLALEER
jgi:tetratricopeptide (TPR) repeat protein